MKIIKLNYLFIISLGMILTLGMSSCGSSEKTVSAKKQGEELLEVYCTGSDFQSNKNYFRASAIGESLDQMVAKKKAGVNARAELATLISSVVRGTIDNYTNSTELNNVEQVEERYEGLTREVINQQLSNIKIICEKQTRTAEKKYKTYLAVEMSVKDLKEALNKKLSQDDKLKVDYDYERFVKKFEAEMKKVENK